MCVCVYVCVRTVAAVTTPIRIKRKGNGGSNCTHLLCVYMLSLLYNYSPVVVYTLSLLYEYLCTTSTAPFIPFILT